MFPTCRFLVDAFESKHQLPILEREVLELQDGLDSLEREGRRVAQSKDLVDRSDDRRARLVTLAAKRDNVRLQIENLRLQVSGLRSEREKGEEARIRYERIEESIQKNDEIDVLILMKRDERADKEEEIQNHRDELSKLTLQMGATQANLKKLEEQLVELQGVRDLVTANDHYIEAMGKDGIAYEILAQKLPLINEEINKVLSNAADFGVFIEHDTEEEALRIYIQYGQYKSRLIEMAGGAEKMLASIAIRRALLNISNLPRSNVFIIDEGFGKLDPEYLDSIQRMLDYLKTTFDHVIVISHLETMKDMVDNMIEITADDEGYAHVELA
jgi:DNA repair exonuclease SbcCD ATPase subunit